MTENLSSDISVAGYNLLLREHAEKLLHTFNREGIRTILLKGIALLYDVYENPSERILSDIDILIHPEDLDKAESVLSKSGFKFDDTNHSNAVVYKINSDPDIFLDLHCHLYNLLSPSQKRIYDPDENEIWARAIPVRFGQEETLILSPEDRIIYLCFHLLKERFSNHKWLRDLSLLIQKNQEKLDEDYFLRTSKKSGTYKLCLMIIDHLGKIRGSKFKLLSDQHPENEFRMYKFEKTVFDLLLRSKLHPLREALWIISMDSGDKQKGFFLDLLRYIPKKIKHG